jgi:hypothetical protein
VDADLLELLHFTIKFLPPQLDNAGISVRTIVKSEVSIVLVDVDQYYKNAMESMSRKKQLLISIFADDDDVILDFDNQGQDIAAECMGRIFELYLHFENGWDGPWNVYCSTHFAKFLGYLFHCFPKKKRKKKKKSRNKHSCEIFEKISYAKDVGNRQKAFV